MGSSPFSVLNGNRLIFVPWAEPGGVPRLQVLEISERAKLGCVAQSEVPCDAGNSNAYEM